jgi:hypothetical protein
MILAARRAVKIPQRQARARIAIFLRLQYAICQKRFPVLVQKVSRALPPAAPPLDILRPSSIFHSFVEELYRAIWLVSTRSLVLFFLFS